MTISRRKPKDARKRILRAAEEIVTDKIADNSIEELTKIGIVWCGILDLDSSIPPSEVAAMLAAADLIRATHYVDSEQYWTSAAAYSALGAFSEPTASDEVRLFNGEDEDEKSAPIGFAPGHTKTSN